MPVIATGTITTQVLGIWRRLSLLSSDGSLSGLDGYDLYGRLEQFGIPTHQHPFVRTILSWREARIPTDVAFALWLLRQRQEADGCIYRLADSPIGEAGPAIRYIQLAAAAGETLHTDPALRKAVQWLLNQQLPDGSIADLTVLERGETGTTARALRALCRLHEPSLEEPLARMRAYLGRAAVKQEVGIAWPQTEGDLGLVIASTSLVALALLESDPSSPLIPEALRFLLVAQCDSGGWPTIVGYEASLHNTFNAVRALRAGKSSGVLQDDLTLILDSARRWFLADIKRRPPRTTIDIAFALRLANLLDLLHLKASERLALALIKRRRHTLIATADLYAETQIMALALLECSQRLDKTSPGQEREPWMWRLALPTVPPPFLVREAHFYEALYSAFKGRWWLRVVDFVARASLVEGIAGLLLGVIAALSIIDDRLTATFTLSLPNGRSLAAVVSIAVLLLLWFGVKVAARSARQGAVWTSVAALAAALTMTWILDGSGPRPQVLPVVALYWLVIDMVSFTADRAGLLDRLLPR